VEGLREVVERLRELVIEKEFGAIDKAVSRSPEPVVDLVPVLKLFGIFRKLRALLQKVAKFAVNQNVKGKDEKV
jgi:hypothetical protein